MDKKLSAYFAELGRLGGKKSKRKITPVQQAMMQKARKKKPAQKRQKN
jgi:hypothetical protein